MDASRDGREPLLARHPRRDRDRRRPRDGAQAGPFREAAGEGAPPPGLLRPLPPRAQPRPPPPRRDPRGPVVGPPGRVVLPFLSARGGRGTAEGGRAGGGAAPTGRAEPLERPERDLPRRPGPPPPSRRGLRRLGAAGRGGAGGLGGDRLLAPGSGQLSRALRPRAPPAPWGEVRAGDAAPLLEQQPPRHELLPLPPPAALGPPHLAREEVPGPPGRAGGAAASDGLRRDDPPRPRPAPLVPGDGPPRGGVHAPTARDAARRGDRRGRLPALRVSGRFPSRAAGAPARRTSAPAGRPSLAPGPRSSGAT